MLSILGARSRLGMVLGALLMTGCQAHPSTAALPWLPVDRQSMTAEALPVTTQVELLQVPSGDPSGAFAQLKLTDEQKRQLDALPAEAQSDSSAEVLRLLRAPEVDTSALKAALTPTEASTNASVASFVALWKILTPPQRQQVVTRMKQDPPTRSETLGQTLIPETVKQRLGLTPEQEKALTAMNTALKAHHRATQARMVSATEAFHKSGDVEALRRASLAHAQAMPVDVMVAFYASLSQEQRRLLLGEKQEAPSDAKAP